MTKNYLAIPLAVFLAAAWLTCPAKAQGIKLGNACILRTGSGSPEASVSGSKCDTYWRTDTGTIYTKTSGTATTTGWTLLAGAGSAGSLASLYVGNSTASFTSPTRLFDGSYALSGALGATNYAFGKFALTMAPSAAPSGTARAFEMLVSETGTFGHTGEISAGLFNNQSSTSGTITEENGGLFAVQRSVGTSTLSRGLRVDRTYSSAATITSSRGIAITAPSLTGGATIGTNIGLEIANQSGATTSAQFVSTSANGNYTHYADGSKFNGVTKNTTAATAVGGYTEDISDVTYTGGAGSGYHYIHENKVTATPSADTSGEAWISSYSLVVGGNTRNVGMLVASYGTLDLSANNALDAWSPVNGGGAHVYLGDANHYGTTTLGLIAGFTAWGGTGTGATVTGLYGFYVPQLYEYSGTVTTKVGLQVDDQSTGASGITNNYLIRAQSPNGDFIQHANGVTQAASSTFSTLPSCSSTYKGGFRWVTDSTTATWGATITGTGGNAVMAVCNGTNWTVMGK